MKKIIIMISITMLIAGGVLFSISDKVYDPIPASKIMELKGKIQAVMTEIPAGQPVSGGAAPVAFMKVKMKDPATGQEHSIQIAPGDFLRLKGVILQKDDQIRIKAFKSNNSPEFKSLEIEIKGKLLILRDRVGRGMWEKPLLRPNKTDLRKR